MNSQQSIESGGKYDVIVAGGGVAGTAAAVSAAREGMSVLLTEKTLQLGGLACAGLINLFVPMCNGRGVQIIKGMAEEFLRLSVKNGYDTIPDEWKNGEPGKDAKTRYITRFSAPVFSLELMRLLKNEGITVMFDTTVTEPIMDKRRCTGLILFNKSGYTLVKGKIIIDATGDADILRRAGVPVLERGNFNTYMGFYADTESCRRVYENGDFRYLSKYFGGGMESLYGDRRKKKDKLWDGANGDDVTEYVIKNQLDMLEKLEKTDRKKRDILTLPIMPQFRTTRCIDGNYTLREGDEYRHFDDSISVICDFDRKDFLYEVPYGTLVRDGFDNLITAGRSASAEGYLWDVLRVIPPAIVTGQAAGIAAAYSVKNDKKIYKADTAYIQKRLIEENVMIHFDDSLIPKDKEKIEYSDIGHI